MKDILKSNKNIIINTDIDGILCGLLLHNYLGCEVVGFSNSAETVWIDPNKIQSVYDAVYIDMYVPKPEVITIDQHIIAFNESHYKEIKKNPNKINPNLDNPRFFLPNPSYYLKYPFGTIHYICAALEKEGVNISFDLNDVEDGIRLGELILRADDAMTTSLHSNYMKNAKDWWDWLFNFSSHGEFTRELTEFLYNTPSQNALPIKKQIADLFLGPRFRSDSPDGGYKEIFHVGDLVGEFQNFILYIAKRTKLQPFDFLGICQRYDGKVKRMYMNDFYANELTKYQTIDGENVFSYAFVRSSNRPANFSYTKELRRDISVGSYF